MFKTRLLSAALLSLLTFGVSSVHAQGITTGAIVGTITDSNGAPIDAAQVQVINRQTGTSAGALTRDGRFTVQGLEVGGPYSVTARRIGFEPQTRDNITVKLGEAMRTDFQLAPQATVLAAVQVSGEAAGTVISPTHTGTQTTFSDSALRRLPSLNRNFSDFVNLVPQVSTTSSAGSASAGGVNIRQNAIQIDGAGYGDIFGIGSTGQPGSQSNSKSISLDAVKEYQVLLAPFDIRQGNFGGMLLNAVTKSGTNSFHGSAYRYLRDQNLTRSQPYLNDFYQAQYGGTIGGPILKNRLFFFISAENQQQRQPGFGPFIGSTADSTLAAQSIVDLGTSAAKYGLTDIGGGGNISKLNPNRNVFARIDAYLPFNTRLVLRHNYASADNTNTPIRSASSTATPTFALTSNSYLISNKTRSTVGELLTNLPRGIFNELLLNKTTIRDFRTVPILSPQITVRALPRADGKTANVIGVFGTESSSQGNYLDQDFYEVTENLTIPVSSHSFTVGLKNVNYKPVNLFAANSRGSWTFNNLAAFDAGTPSAYIVQAPAPTDPYNGLATFKSDLRSLYVQDVWQATKNLSLTAGIRTDKPTFRNVPPFNQSVQDQYGRNTSFVPEASQVSPRVAFNWDITGDQANQLRGGIGYFTGPPPFVYVSNAFGGSGLSGFVQLSCNNTTTATTSFLPPAFNTTNINTPPTACAPSGTLPGASISGPASNASVSTIDPGFKFPKYQKASFGYDHRFSNGMVGSLEGLYTKAKQNVFYQNLALVGPQFTDVRGRVIYGTKTATGQTPTTKGPRTSVLDLSNAGGDKSYSLSSTVQKTFSNSFEALLSYTYSQSRDVTTTTNSTSSSNYRFQRDLSGNILDKYTSRSKNDLPHKIVAMGSYRFRTLTDLSVVYTGNSGAPYDYIYGAGTCPVASCQNLGDINSDGSQGNDIVYVPKNAFDQTEILFSGFNGTAAQQANAQAQAVAFDNFINTVPCLRNNRGKLLTRNVCRNPWQTNFDVSAAQSLEAFGQQNLQLRLDIFNFGNFLNKKWGQQAYSDQGNTCGRNCSATVLLSQTGNIVNADRTQTQPIFTFDPNYKRFNSANAESNYRMQLSIRYSF